jgi:multicomponent K+:H+ antiporter subunit G
MGTETMVVQAVRELPAWLDAAASLLLVGGAAFAVVGSIGLLRLRDFAMRLHAPTKASTMGVGGALLASMICMGWQDGRLPVHELLITLFVFVTAPVSAHLLIRAALERVQPTTAANGAARPQAETPSDRPESGGSPE